MSGACATWTGPLLDLSLHAFPPGRCLVAPGGHLLRARAGWQRSTIYIGGSGLGSGCVSTGVEAWR
jgi:hypothetical protein